MTFSSEPSGGGLPGVMPDGPSPAVAAAQASASAPAPAVATAAPGTPAPPSPAGEAGAPIDGTAAPTGTEPTGSEVPADPNAPPFTFAGKQYVTQAEAENFLRTQTGRVDALTKRTGEYASLTNAWMEYANGLQKQLDAAKGGQPPAQGNSSTAAAPDSPNAWIDGLDWAFYAQLSKENGAEYAGHWLAQQLTERNDKHVEKLLEERFKPIATERRQQEEYQRVSTTFEAAAARTDASGAPLYPELTTADEAVGQVVFDIWKSLPEQVRNTERGVVLAIAEYRLQNGGPPRPAAGTAGGASPSPSQVLRAQEGAASQVVNGTGAPRPASSAAMSAEARVRQQIRDAGVPRAVEGRSLGFAE
jgi:hypothetical protein